MSTPNDPADRLKAIKDRVTKSSAKTGRKAGESVMAKMIAAGKAPYGTTGPVGRDSQPYSFVNVMKAYRTGNAEHAKEEFGISELLVKHGYGAPMEGILAPLDPYLIEQRFPREFAGLVAKCAISDRSVDAWHDRGDRVRRKAMGVFGDDSLGGALVMPVLDQTLIDLLRPQVVMERAKCQVVELPPSGQLVYARQTADPTFQWLGENQPITDSTPTLGNIVLAPKEAAGFVILSNQSIMYSAPSAEQIARNSLAQRGAVFLDQAYIYGTGTTFSPRGVINYPNITTHTAETTGTNGDTYGFSDPKKQIGEVFAANDPMGPTAFIMHPTLWAALTTRRADATTPGDGKGAALFWVSAGDAEKGIPDKLAGYPVLPSTIVPTTRSKGSSGATLTFVLCGNFRHAVIARSGVIQLALDQGGTFFQNNQTAMRAVFYTDFALLQEKPISFCDSVIVG